MTTDPYTGVKKYDPANPPTREEILRARYERRIAKRDWVIKDLRAEVDRLTKKCADASLDRHWLARYLSYAIEDVIRNVRLTPRTGEGRKTVNDRLAEVDRDREQQSGRLPGQEP